MAHAAPPPPGHRRRNAIIGAVVVVVGVVLAVIAVIGLNHPKNTDASGSTTSTRTVTSASRPSTSSRPTTSPSTTSAPSTTPPTTSASSTRSTSASSSSPAPSSVPLVVLNNTGRVGLAATAESRFEAKGDIISTCAYWDSNSPGAEAAATLLQKQFPNILRVKQRFDGLPSGPVVVVLNDDYS
jgi:cytoskeletal protein RodZ